LAPAPRYGRREGGRGGGREGGKLSLNQSDKYCTHTLVLFLASSFFFLPSSFLPTQPAQIDS